MRKLLLLGDEAIAQGALDAGISGIYAYPGTPSTEIMEYVQASEYAAQHNVHALWSANEKTAMEEALGMSYAGKRALVAMKHVGLNVAADPFMNAAITGVNGGLVVVAADDPSMHSSQNEQDSRYYGKFAQIPVFEPSTQQEAYNMIRNAFDLSEKYGVPVLMRITTRLAHSRSQVETRPPLPQKPNRLPEDPLQFVLLPALARKRYKRLLTLQEEFLKASEQSPFNSAVLNPVGTTGIIACGTGWNYLNECFPEGNYPGPVYKLSQYPLPVQHIQKIFEQSSAILVLEDGYPFVEEMLSGTFPASKQIKGRLDGTIPRDGELTPDIVASAFGFPAKQTFAPPPVVVPRPPSLCNGCSHADLYLALDEVMQEFGKGKVFSDIGCYTLGALPPYNAIYSCVDMGASITMAKGAADAGMSPSVCVIGDSTFTHSGMTGLLDAVIENSPITVIISDNSATAMTGGQKSHATNRLVEICKGLGVSPDHIVTLVPLKKNHEQNVQVLRQEILYRGLSVVIFQRECIQTSARRHKKN